MIIFKQHKIVLITPPRTGSTALHSYFDSELWVYDKEMFQHTLVVPSRYQDYEKVLVVRDPYSRAYSLYKFAVERGLCKQHKFEACCDKYFNTNHWYFKPLSYYRDNLLQISDEGVIQRIETCSYIKLETLNVDLTLLLKTKVNVPRQHSIRTGLEESVLTKGCIQKINSWASKDFEEFKYPQCQS